MSYAEHARQMIVMAEERFDDMTPSTATILELAKAYALLAIAQEISKIPGSHG